tara:strand:- start:1755 stop:1943 length:189 start_codon:yes stop_codon:yes gene_type:complete
MQLKMINDIIGKFCPTTVFLNVGAIGMSMTDVEIGLKIISYAVAIVWTSLKIMNEYKSWKKK